MQWGSGRRPECTAVWTVAVVTTGVMAALATAMIAGAAPTLESPVTLNVMIGAASFTLSSTSVPAGLLRVAIGNATAVARACSLAPTRAAVLGVPAHGAKKALVTVTGTAVRLACSAPGQHTLSALVRVAGPPARTAAIVGRSVALVPVATGLGSPVTGVVAVPGDDARMVVVEQSGLVQLYVNGQGQPTPFVDLRDVVGAEGEKGLLSLAFPSDYATSGLAYVFYNNMQGNIRVVEFHRSASAPDTLDRATRRRLLALTKPTADHNGGMLQFGTDGYLYASIGDGGANPPTIPVGVTGQTLDDLFGSIIRIDPRTPGAAGSPYAIPAGNPFRATPGADPEIVAYGLRNPWRFSIDPSTGTMLIGDVGEGSREEIDALPLARLGLDFGWPCREGSLVPPLVAIPTSCASATLTPPLLEYPHSQTRCSVTAGVTEHDPRLPALAGLFIWSDLCDGQLYSLDPASGATATLGASVVQPTAFGQDGQQRVYVGTGTGAVYRLDPLS